MKQKFNIKIDDMLAVEGCLEDDKTVLGGQSAFLSHFCTFYNFNICYGHAEAKPIKKLQERFSDPDTVEKGIENWIAKIDQMQ